jgi:PleD family two-component response regulator
MDTRSHLLARAVDEIVTSITVTPMPAGDLKIAVTVSGGCAVGQDDSPDDLVNAADVRLYEAKAAGRNRIVAAPGVR